MHSRLPLLALGPLLCAALAVAVPAPAIADGETCQGQPATIVVTGPVEEVSGTEDADVVVIDKADGRSIGVRTGGGDDLVCLRGGGPYFPTLFTGEGNDSVVVEDLAAQSLVQVDLGTGSDHFVGGPERDGVEAGGPAAASDGPDSISTGDGDDDVHVTGAVGSISMGNGSDEVFLVDPILTGPIDAGRGSGVLHIEGLTVKVDLRNEALRAGGPPQVPLLGVDSAVVTADRAVVVGGAAADYFRIDACRSVIKGGRGDDRFEAPSSSPPTSGCSGDQRWFGNQGDDRMSGTRRTDEFFGGPGDDVIYGAPGANRISGGGGDDKIFGARDRDVLFGGNGNDRLFGLAGNDALYGGAGRDQAKGNNGRDRCVAEIRVSCER